MIDQRIAAREAYDAADAIVAALVNTQRRALAEEINDLLLYLESQMRNQYQKADCAAADRAGQERR